MALPILGAIAGTLLRGAGSMLARGGVALARGVGASGRTAGRVAQGSLNRAGKRLRKRKPAGSGNQQQPTSTAPGGSAGAVASGGSGGQGQGQGGQSSNPLSMSPGIPNMMQDFADNLRQSSKGLLEFAASTGKASVAMQGIDRAKDAFKTLREAQLGQAAAPIAAREIAAEQRIQAVTPTDKAMAKAMAELYASWAEFKATFMPAFRNMVQNVLMPIVNLANGAMDLFGLIYDKLAEWFDWAKRDKEKKEDTPLEGFVKTVAQEQRDKDKKLGRK